MTDSVGRNKAISSLGGRLFGRSGSLFGRRRRRENETEPRSDRRYPPAKLDSIGFADGLGDTDEETRGRSAGGQDKNRRRSRSRSLARSVSQTAGRVTRRFSFVQSKSITNQIGLERKRESSRSVSRARPVNTDDSILLYEKTRANASIQLRLDHLIAGRYGPPPAWYLRIGVSVARGRLDIKDAIFRIKFRCRHCGEDDLYWRIKKFSPLKLLGRGTDVNYIDRRSTEVGAQVGREEVKGETKVSYGKERSYVQENCYALEIAETNNRLQAHLWRVGDASTVTPPSRFTIQTVVSPPLACTCHKMEVTADLDINKGSERARGSWRPVPISNKHALSVLMSEEMPDFAEWKEDDWMANDNSELFESGRTVWC
ncbi:hypothetical protein V8F20_008811 [Naviculisporaceae sp. PSN 640]